MVLNCKVTVCTRVKHLGNTDSCVITTVAKSSDCIAENRRTKVNISTTASTFTISTVTTSDNVSPKTGEIFKG